MFDLEEAIAAWKKGASPDIDPEKLEELESHLREDVETREKSGLSTEEAFVLAHHRLGDISMLEREFALDEGKLDQKSKTKIANSCQSTWLALSSSSDRMLSTSSARIQYLRWRF